MTSAEWIQGKTAFSTGHSINQHQGWISYVDAYIRPLDVTPNTDGEKKSLSILEAISLISYKLGVQRIKNGSHIKCK
jgi:hypothetical protein